jgi:hypothetical protein
LLFVLKENLALVGRQIPALLSPEGQGGEDEYRGELSGFM